MTAFKNGLLQLIIWKYHICLKVLTFHSTKTIKKLREVKDFIHIPLL